MDPLSAIASTISIIQSIAATYNTIKKLQGLPKAFNAVQESLPIVQVALVKAHGFFEHSIDNSAKEGAQPILSRCQKNAATLNDVFLKLAAYETRSDDKTWDTLLKKWHTLALPLRTGQKVETLMKGILEDLDLLIRPIAFDDRAFQAQWHAAITQLADVEPSIPDAESLGGTQHIASGGTGYQYNNQGGQQNNNTGAGRMYNAERMYFGSPHTDDETRKKKLEILKTLHTTPYKERKDRNPCRVPGTLEWFVQHESFRQWNDASASTMLWVSADPGAGKSVLARHLVDNELMRQRHPNGDVVPPNGPTTVCYFFFKDDFTDQRSAKEAVSCIIHQLLTERKDLFTDTILDRFETGGGYDRQSFHDLWDILITTLLQASSGQRERDPANNAHTTHPPLHVLCVLDAFDECNLTDQRTLAKALGDFYAGPLSHNSNVVLKFLVTSRPYRNIEQEFRYNSKPNLSFVRLSGESPDEVAKIQNEIGIYIQAKLDDIAHEHDLSAAEKKHLHDKVLQIPHRTYLWVYLTLDLIQREFDEDMDLDMALCHLPTDVDDAYEKILARIKPKDVAKARRLLHIVVAAVRPLTLDEVNFALALEQRDRSYDDVRMVPPDRFPKYIRNLCGLFVTVVDGRVYLLHQTAKTFLVGSDAAAAPQPIPFHAQNSAPRWQASFVPSASHRILATICVWHLHFETFVEDTPGGDELLSVSDYDDYTDNYVFLEYSACNWPDHVRQSDARGDDPDVLSLLCLCGPSPQRTVTWLDIYSTYEQNYVILDADRVLVAAAFCGLDAVVRALLACPGIDVSATDEMYGRSALHWAANNGFDDVVEQLLLCPDHRPAAPTASRGVLLDARDLQKSTPLAIATENGCEAIVRQLLQAGADANAVDASGRSALMYAAADGQLRIAQMLLEAGADVDAATMYGDTALTLAVQKGHVAMVQQLAQITVGNGIHGADAVHALGHGKTPVAYRLDEPGTAHHLESRPIPDDLILDEDLWNPDASWDDKPVQFSINLPYRPR
ncbi:hypothetical protein SPBR_04625 [Sporothrix brasiliensis 5110]|uniref:Uncharacterized protein n=1 Tax=Sporothrix brasiliensis 5110 TaxID=1398154 RepID=A0A0C2IRX9_9PEZI|nr:uncharacterized protein SPBR_04625 [Sporothrix brasiliensis 5110]KIH87757.1 hypothetical protein SPBR_04625 [Sporothrix brasiliensis 5110]